MVALRPKHFSRYRDMALLLIRHRQRDLVTRLGLDRVFHSKEDRDRPREQADAEHLAADLERMGPAYVKLGQMLATRTDMLPDAYIRALRRLQDNCTPLPFSTIESLLVDELSVPQSSIFAWIQPQPLASGSIGQVHRAKLRSSGKEVVIKLQRPGVAEVLFTDLDVLNDLAYLLDTYTEHGRRYRFRRLLAALRRSLMDEVDYRVEAENARQFEPLMEDFPSIMIPQPIDDLTTDKLLVTEYVSGKKISQFGPAELKVSEREELGRELLRCYLYQVLVDGFFHADPHPGNVFITDERKLALIDFGMVVRVPEATRSGLAKLVLALNDGDGESVASAAEDLGRIDEPFHRDDFRERIHRLVADYERTPTERLNAGNLVMELTAIAGESGLVLPLEVTMLGKVLLHMDETLGCLAPTLNTREEIRRNSMSIIEHSSRSMIGWDRLRNTFLETGELATELPRRMNKLTKLLADNRLELRVRTFDETRLMANLQKIANRVAAGVVLAAMIIAASLMMHMDTQPRVFGYPMIALIFLLLATIGGTALVIQSLLHDD